MSITKDDINNNHMKRGKLLWNELKVISAEWNDGYGHIDIHIPLKLNIPYDVMDDTGWVIRDAVCSKLIQLQWPFEGKEKLYFFYHADLYHLQIMTHQRATVYFYKKMIKEL